MPRFIRWLTFSAAVMIMAWPGGRAEASFLYSFSGTLGTDIGAASGLAGGSFSGTYISTGFSGYVEFATFQVNLYNGSGVLIDTIIPPPPPFREYGGGYFDSTIGGPGRGVMVFYDATNPSPNSVKLLQLVFPLPFDGNGSAIPYDLGGPNRSALLYKNFRVRVASATSFLVPAPSSIVLMGISGLAAGLGGIGLRRKRATS